MLLSALLEGFGMQTEGKTNLLITGIAYDSRLVQPGFLFVAIEGFKSDGHDFIGQAVRAGAAAVVVNKDAAVPAGVTRIKCSDSRLALALLSARFYGNPSEKIKLVGVTGTNGKTTTTNLLAAVFRDAGEKVGLIGTIANYIGDKYIPVSHTTPESADLQKLLGEMVAEGVDAVVMEVSSHALALNRVAGCEYDVAVFTNITRDHLDFHGDMDSYLAAKARLFSDLGQGAKGGPKYAVLNADDPRWRDLAAVTGVPVVTYAIHSEALIQAVDIDITARGVSFTARSGWGEKRLNLKLTGMFNVYNALAAYAAGVAGGLPPGRVVKALESVSGVPGRFEPVEMGQDFAVIVDYAHTPDGLENVLKTAREITRGRLIAVFGCGGDRDRTKRPLMGRIAACLSDLAIVTSDNPRTEDPLKIIADVVEGVGKILPEGGYKVIPDRREAIRQAIFDAGAGDVVLIAGKGHEDYQIIGDIKYHFDDREEARRCLEEKMKV